MDDLKIKVIGYSPQTKPSEIEAAVNHFMAHVKVHDVQVVPFLGSVVIHIFYYGDEPTYEQPPGQ